MSVTKLVPACFDLNEGSRNIIIHHFCSVYICVVWEWRWQAGGRGGGGFVCVCVPERALLSTLLQSKTEALCRSASPPPLCAVGRPGHLPAPQPLHHSAPLFLGVFLEAQFTTRGFPGDDNVLFFSSSLSSSRGLTRETSRGPGRQGGHWR